MHPENRTVLPHTLPAVSVTPWVHDYPPPIRAMILATAAFHVKLYVPFAIPFLRMKQKLFGPGQVKSYVKSKLLTRDQEQAAQYDADPLIFRQIAQPAPGLESGDRKSTRLNSSHSQISYAVFCLNKNT